MYWTGAFGGVVVVFCGMGLVVNSLTDTTARDCKLKVLSTGEEVVACNDGSVNRLEPRAQPVVEQLDFRGKELSGTDFGKHNLRGARFDGCVLNGVQFRGADLTHASFEGAALYYLDFREANLTGVNLKNAILRRSQVEGVVWSDTICPTGVLSSANFGTCRGQLLRK